MSKLEKEEGLTEFTGYADRADRTQSSRSGKRSKSSLLPVDRIPPSLIGKPAKGTRWLSQVVRGFLQVNLDELSLIPANIFQTI